MMAKTELFGFRPLGWYLRAMRAFPVRRDSPDLAAVRRACRLLDHGECVVMWPEGRVTRDGTLGRGYPGAGMLALRAGVSVVPAVVWNTRLFRGPVRVRFGPPLDLSAAPDAPRHDRNRWAVDRIMEAIAHLLPAVDGPEQPPPAGPDAPRAQRAPTRA